MDIHGGHNLFLMGELIGCVSDNVFETTMNMLLCHSLYVYDVTKM